MKLENYDFSGYASRNNLLCSDGVTIRKDAFKGQDGDSVSMVWSHNHNEPDNVIGHADLENREDGVYAYCKLNDSPKAKKIKSLVHSGDLRSLSIFANNLTRNGDDIIHGIIREVSVVLSGANPGAKIDQVLAHTGDASDDGYEITYDEGVTYIAHADNSDGDSKKKEEPKDDKTLEDVINTMTEEQKTAMYTILATLMKDEKDTDTDTDADDKNNTKNKEDDEMSMKHNVFDNNANQDFISHDALNTLVDEAKRGGSLKDTFIAHGGDYGIDNIDYLFPEYKSINGDIPTFINNKPEGWAQVIMSGIHKTPFAKVKMAFADIREDEARAKGYIKGKLKQEEVFSLLKRVVSPTTIYKKQKLDRDDIVDINFDVVGWIKKEMRLKLDEEIARAIVFGDGRSSVSNDKINEANIIPIVKDNELFVISKTVTPEAGESDSHALIRTAIKAQDEYEGSGNLTAFMSMSTVSDMLLMEDTLGHRMYKDIKEVALAIGVNNIVKVPATIMPADVTAVIVDLSDYNVGADKGGEVSMFEDFDIDFNQEKYLIETRCSGALTKPYSAIVLKKASE